MKQKTLVTCQAPAILDAKFNISTNDHDAINQNSSIITHNKNKILT